MGLVQLIRTATEPSFFSFFEPIGLGILEVQKFRKHVQQVVKFNINLNPPRHFKILKISNFHLCGKNFIHNLDEFFIRHPFSR
jgi:hypothetical protein